jgi:uncharacterized membrane protein
LKPPRPLTVSISPELRARLEACKPAGVRGRDCPLSPEKRAAMMEYYGKVNQQELADILGISKTTMSKWYRRFREAEHATA